MSDEEVNLSLKVGLLTQSKVFGEIAEELKSISFIHKSHQEFFAAVFLTRCQSPELPLEFTKAITSLDRAMDMEKVVLFVCGMNFPVGCRMLEFITRLINADERVLKYRASYVEGGIYSHEELIERTQNMFMDCLEEAQKNGVDTPRLQWPDVRVYKDNISRVFNWINMSDINHAKSLLSRVFNRRNVSGTNHVKSIVMKTPSDVPYVITTKCRSLVESSKSLSKLYLSDQGSVFSEDDLFHTVHGCKSTLQALYVNNVDLPKRGRKLVKCLPRNLTSLALINVTMEHGVLQNLSRDVPGLTKLKELCLMGLSCKTHGGWSGDCMATVNLRPLTTLELVNFGWLPVQEILMSAPQLLYCVIHIGLRPTFYTSLYKSLHKSKLLEWFGCANFSDPAAVKGMVNVLPTLLSLKRIHLLNIDFGESDLFLSRDMDKLEFVMLGKLEGLEGPSRIKGSALKTLVDTLPPHRVEVRLLDITITDGRRSGLIIDDIRKSTNFVVVQDKVENDDSVATETSDLVVEGFRFHSKQPPVGSHVGIK